MILRKTKEGDINVFVRPPNDDFLDDNQVVPVVDIEQPQSK